MVFVFGSVYVVNYVDRLAYVEPALHPWDESYLIVMDRLFDLLLPLVCQYLLKIFTSMFIMDIGLKFSFFVESLLGFGIRMMLVSQNVWEGFPLFVLFGIVSEGVVPAPLCKSGTIWL